MRYDDETRRREEERWRYEQRRIRRRKRLRRQRLLRFAFIITILFAGLALVLVLTRLYKRAAGKEEAVMAYESKYVADAPDYRVELLDYNEYSRPGDALPVVNGIVIHYTANPGTTAEQNRNYFQGLKDSGETYASSHFVIGIEGEIVQCIPCNEIAYASNDRNSDTIAIECCIPDESGRFTDATYQSLVHLTTWLMGRYDLVPEDVIRHYDVTGKACPKYYVEHEEEWLQFKENLLTYIEANGIAKNEEIK